MQSILAVKLILLSSAFAFPSLKSQGKVALLKEGEQQMDKPRITGSDEEFVRTQRNLIQFRNMIKCTTGRSSLYYIDYGCYCGYGGKGAPVDDLDRCCEVHDECYKRIMDHPSLCSYSSAVYWKVYARDDTCTGCADQAGTCERAICDCDGAAATCFAQHEWNEEHYNYPPSQC